MFGLAPQELIVVAVIAVLLFGSKLPDVARSLGGSYREFRRGLNDMQQQFREVEREVTKTINAPAVKKIDSLEDEELDQEPAAPKFAPPPVDAKELA
jgi:sec-independent protein translocase protein TatA